MTKTYYIPLKNAESEREVIEDFSEGYSSTYGDAAKPVIVSVEKQPCWLVNFNVYPLNPNITLKEKKESKPVEKVR